MQSVHYIILDSGAYSSLHKSLLVLFQAQDILGMPTVRKRTLDNKKIIGILILDIDSDTHISEDEILPHLYDRDRQTMHSGPTVHNLDMCTCDPLVYGSSQWDTNKMKLSLSMRIQPLEHLHGIFS
jgi:hypothetical protein